MIEHRIEEVLKEATAKLASIIQEEAQSMVSEALSGISFRLGASGAALSTAPSLTASRAEAAAEAEEEEEEIEAARPSNGNGHPAKKKPGRKKSGKGVSEETIAAVLAFVRENPKLRSEEIQKQMVEEYSADDVRGALAHLRNSGGVKVKGERRSARYVASAPSA